MGSRRDVRNVVGLATSLATMFGVMLMLSAGRGYMASGAHLDIGHDFFWRDFLDCGRKPASVVRVL
jgi:hypothetical protein